MNSKFGMFSVLAFSVMMLFIPASSLANAQEYDQYYENEQYKKKDDKKSSDEPVIIIKNEPIQKKEKKKMKEPPMILVKKDVLFCEEIANGTEPFCFEEGDLSPDSDRWVQDCTATNEFEFICDNFNEKLFNMIVTDDIKFPGSESKKINFNGERYNVIEEEIDIDLGLPSIIFPQICLELGFDDSNIIPLDVGPLFAASCVQFEGECSGIVQDGELKECTVKNYLVNVFED